MHPEQIKAELRMKGITLTALADECDVSRSMVTQVIYGVAKSQHIAKRISEIVGKPVGTLWPVPKPTLRRTRAAQRVAA